MSFNKESLLKQSQAMKALEEHAEEMYVDIIKGLINPEIIQIVDKIRKDEQKHQKIIQEIINMLGTGK